MIDHRPLYHVMPPSNWMNDPIMFFWQKRYHLFYEYDSAYGDCALGKRPWGSGKAEWGHASSSDLVHWIHHPVALSPDVNGPDKDGCWTGCVIEDKGQPYIFYTGVRPEVQCLASSKDMIYWEKYSGNPLISAPPQGLKVTGFRDPCVWKEKDSWFMLLGSGLEGGGGVVLLLSSQDMLHWEYKYPFYVDQEKKWRVCECPDFFPLGGKHVLLVSTQFNAGQDGTYYVVGKYADHRFICQKQEKIDSGGYLFAAKTLLDDRGRRLLWGWILDAPPRPEYCWAGVQSLPRELYLDADGEFGVRPVPELGQLRQEGQHYDDLVIAADTEIRLDAVRGNCLEIQADIVPDAADKFGVHICCAPDGSEQTIIVCDFKQGVLSVDRKHSSLKWGPDDKADNVCRVKYGQSLALHVFLDRSVIEVFADDKVCLTSRIYPSRDDSLGVSLSAGLGDVRIRRLDAWQLRP